MDASAVHRRVADTEEPPAMSKTDASPSRTPQHIGALAALVMVAVSCGGVASGVEVPGAAPVTVPTAPFDEVFTPGTVTDPVQVDSAPSTIAPTDAATDADVIEPVPPLDETSQPTDAVETTDAVESTVAVESTTSVPSIARPPLDEDPAVTAWEDFDQHLTSILDAGSQAVSATVLRDGEVIHEVALGQRTPDGDAVEVGDRYRIASISKVITSITVLRLVEQGVIGLDDPVGERLASRVGVDATASGVERITVRHLLTHRSGIGQYENLVFRRQVESCDQAAATGLSRNLERSPGTTLRYSNLNFCLLGLLIEDITGQAYEDVVRAEVLAPLGIDEMRMAGTFDVRDGEVEHRSDDGRNYMEVLDAAGSWIASPTEVATIIDSLDTATSGWKPLGPDLLAQMQAITADPPLPPDVAATTSTTLEPPAPPTHGYGMGLMIFGPDSFGHTGTVESTHAMTARQADGITWAVTVSGDYPWSTSNLAGIVAEALRKADIA